VSGSSSRIAYLDWARGMACLLMFQTHCYDAWLGSAARETSFFRWTRLGGAPPAPAFLFLAGVAVALVADRALGMGATARQASRAVMRRGWQIFALALVFRLQEFLLGQPHAPWTDLLRVDVLNIIGLSLVLLGAFVGVLWSASGGSRFRMGAAAGLIAAVVALATQPLWTTHRPVWLPWFLESYINGVHLFDTPQSYFFPLFPWIAFAFAGFAAGCFLTSSWARRRDFAAVALVAGAGAALLALGFWLNSRPHSGGAYDWSHTRANFLMIRIGIVTTLLLAGYLWCRWAPSLWGLSPVMELGKQSLLVYWVSIELAYGGLSIVRKRAQDIPSATIALIALTLAMVALAAFRNRTKGRPLREWSLWRSPSNAAA